MLSHSADGKASEEQTSTAPAKLGMLFANVVLYQWLRILEA